MRILHVLPYDAAKPGGVQTHARALSDWLRGRRHESEIAAPSSGGRVGGVEVIGRPRRVRLGGTDADLCVSPSALRRLRELVREGGWDVVHVQEPLLPALGGAALLGAPRTAAVVCTVHSAEAAAARAYRAAPGLARRLLGRADALVAVSAVALGTAGPGLPGPVRIIPPAIAEVPAEPVARRSAEILFAARDEPRKGLPVLLRAFARLGGREGLRLVAAGPAAESSRRLAERLGIADRVDFAGSQRPEEVRRLMVRAAVFCSPALGGEALGLTLIEAMAAGTPVVASDIAGYRVASRGGRDAVLAEAGDERALAAALERALDDQALRRRLQAGGRARARRFSAASVGAEHERLYAGLIGGAGI